MWEQIGNFLLSQWLWAFTFDWGHVFISAFIMFFLLRLFFRGRFWHSLFVSFGSHLFALAMFSAFVIGVLINIFHWEYNPVATGIQMTTNEVISANLSLAAIIVLLQLVFLFILKMFMHVRVLPYFFVAVISNGIASMISYGGIWMMFGYLF